MTDIILSEIKNGIGIITLNSPKSLNSISLEMARALLAKLQEWKTHKEVHCLFLQGNEKAFCAGGDVRKLYESLKKTKPGTLSEEAMEFFINEYNLDYAIHVYPKPIIAWGDGIVMGGGLGLMIGASHRVVTEKTKLAMPEITIGLYPDVGATWFLNRMPGNWGEYFGLTGARMNGADALYLGLADYYVSSDKKDEFLERLQKISWDQDAKKQITSLLDNFQIKNIIDSSPAKERSEFAKKLSLVTSVEEFHKLLEDSQSDEWIAAGLKLFAAGSPTSALIIFEQLKRGKNLSLKDVFRSELNLSAHFSMHQDFVEGVRALLIDKDLKPNWQNASLKSVETYFTPLWSKEEHPLKSFICESEVYLSNGEA